VCVCYRRLGTGDKVRGERVEDPNPWVRLEGVPVFQSERKACGQIEGTLAHSLTRITLNNGNLLEMAV